MKQENKITVLEMASKGYTAEEIAAYLGYSGTSEVLKHARKENITIRKPTPVCGKNAYKEMALEMEKSGVPRLEIALRLGLTHKAVEKICGPKRNKTTDHEYALRLIAEGYTAKEIVEICGYANISSVYNLAKKHGLKVEKAHSKLHAKMREYKAEGHTMGEVAEHFGISKGHAQTICKGIAPQKARPPKNGYHSPNKGVYQNIDDVKRIISERIPGFEYAGDYTGSNGSVKLRCKTCGDVTTRTWVAVRHGSVECQHCAELKRKRQDGLKELQRIKDNYWQTVRAKQRKRGAQVVRLLKRLERLHHCPVCGKLTTNEKFCSVRCSNKARWSAKDAKRRALIKENLIDKDINLERLYKRDKGVCAICGEPCDWSDSRWEDGFFIVGKKYPSIDHIVPLARGGEHSWENVQLAHFSCNSAKGARWDG